MIPIQDNPQLNVEMQEILTTTPVHADVVNERYEQLLNNDKSLYDEHLSNAKRIGLLELMFSANITGNPFFVSFENLDDVDVTGSWNVSMRRIEF